MELQAGTGEASEEGHPSRYVPPVAMLQFPCDCGQNLEVPPDFEGLTLDCPFCGRTVTARS